MQIIAARESDTVKAAQNFAATLKSGEVIFLRGDLGAGKTVFARSLIRTLAKDEAMEVPSPTFTLVQTYESDNGPVWHFDLYRLEDPEEIYELGWEEALNEGIVIVEWPQRLGTHLPSRYTDIHITGKNDEPETRIIEINRKTA
jgi:tRNA threonylcarbamoyladenosine biosynthesis protein TsaE